MAPDDDPQWEDLRAMLAALEHGSLSEAARSLGVGQSTGRRRIARLEAQLGGRVLDRTPEGVRPAELAERLVPHAELIAEQMHALRRTLAGVEREPRGRVRLALPDGFATTWLLPKLDEFYAVYPEVIVDLVIGTAIVDLVRREADLALRFVTPDHSDLLVRRCARIPLRAFVHPAVASKPVGALRFIALADPAGAYLETQWIRRHAQGASVMFVDNWNALFVAVREGLGAGILSPLVAEDEGLVPLPGMPAVGERDLYLVYHPALREVPRVVALRDWLLGHIPGASA